eukprot:TRINITY_DN10472_c0_g1_i2.p1 TRINITY_DN10472_c0_g1~~TRINITY_DN10472_c0_g1_i2.p1  ORF type:complete len:292 (+),score=39.62 TRINITY_DN10472_c0_g1_i2:84-959(+)
MNTKILWGILLSIASIGLLGVADFGRDDQENYIAHKKDCENSDGCNLNGVCIGGECHCKKGFTGPQCDRCAPAYHDYPECKLDDTCYAVSWVSCPSGEMKTLRHEGMLPGRPSRSVNTADFMVKPNREHMPLGVSIVQGLWGTGTVSLKLCWMQTCGPKQANGGRTCKWSNSSTSIYIKNNACGLTVARKPSRATRPGGFRGECDDPSLRQQQICMLPSKRHAIYVRDVSWIMKEVPQGITLEAANWRGRYIHVDAGKITIRPQGEKGPGGYLVLYPHKQEVTPITNCTGI